LPAPVLAGRFRSGPRTDEGGAGGDPPGCARLVDVEDLVQLHLAGGWSRPPLPSALVGPGRGEVVRGRTIHHSSGWPGHAARYRSRRPERTWSSSSTEGPKAPRLTPGCTPVVGLQPAARLGPGTHAARVGSSSRLGTSW
jgi:hypothetical protein